jgi:hypothetical protein
MTSNPPLFHIGLHKTGTTWLQAELFTAHSSVFVPVSREGRAKDLGTFFIRDEEDYLASPFDLGTDRIRAEMDAIGREVGFGDRVPVVSNERLSGNPFAGSFDARLIADRIHAAFPDARILVVFREQKDMLLSIYLQYLQDGGTDRISDFLERRYDGRRPGFSPSSLKYFDFVRYYGDLFGGDRVAALPYELFKTDLAAFAGSIGALVGRSISIDPERRRTRHNPAKKDYVRRALPAVNLLARPSSINANSPLHLPGVNRSIAWLNSTAARWLRFDDEGLRQTIESWADGRFRASNRDLQGLLKIDLSRYGYDL